MITPQQVFTRERSIADQVLRRLFTGILDGSYGPGARLPSERELVSSLGASRVSVREAFRRLQDWRVIITRKGSGATVLPRRYWTANALASVFLQGLTTGDFECLMPLVSDALGLRRSLVLEFMGRVAGRVRPGALDPAREVVDRAWAVRDDPNDFAVTDWEVIPVVVELAGMYPSLWALNSLAECYIGVMGTVVISIKIPESYVPAHLAVFDAQERGDAHRARKEMGRYLNELDEAIIGSLPPELAARLDLTR